MEHRRLGKSDLELPVVTFGAWAIGGLFWGGTDDQQAIEAIHAAIDHGVNAIDTAPIYGRGHSETVVGQAIRGKRDKLKILTKCGIRWDVQEGEHHFTLPAPGGGEVTAHRLLKADSVIYECEQSLKRLDIDVIDLYQVHAPSESATAEETMGALVKLRQQGKIRHIGVSNYDSRQMAAALEHAPVVSNQIQYSALARAIEKDELPFCREHQLGVICYSPMALGLLSGRMTMDRTFPETDIRSGKEWFKPQNRKRILDALETIRPIADRHKATPGQLAIAWVIAQEEITAALVGARNAQQAVENAAAANLRLSPEDIQFIGQAFAELNMPG